MHFPILGIGPLAVCDGGLGGVYYPPDTFGIVPLWREWARAAILGSAGFYGSWVISSRRENNGTFWLDGIGPLDCDLIVVNWRAALTMDVDALFCLLPRWREMGSRLAGAANRRALAGMEREHGTSFSIIGAAPLWRGIGVSSGLIYVLGIAPLWRGIAYCALARYEWDSPAGAGKASAMARFVTARAYPRFGGGAALRPLVCRLEHARLWRAAVVF